MNSKKRGYDKDLNTSNIDKPDALVAVRCLEAQYFPPSENTWKSFKYPPGTRLSHHIAYYWLIAGSARKTSRISIHPNGGVGLIFNFGEPLTLGETTVGKGLFFDGTSAKTVHLYPVGNINILGIRFKPGGFNRFFATDLGKLHNRFGKFDCVAPVLPDRCLEVIALFTTDEEKIAAIETWLTCKYSEPNGNISLVQSIVDAISSDRFSSDLQPLLYDTDVDVRRLQRLFKKEVGMSPKKLARILRADSARRLLVNNNDLPFLDITYKCGYYDQAHFSRDFKHVFGTTPSAYRKNKRCVEGGLTILE